MYTRAPKQLQSSRPGPNTRCQKCLKLGHHFTYECTNPQPYLARPSRSKQLADAAAAGTSHNRLGERQLFGRGQDRDRPSVEVPDEFKRGVGGAGGAGLADQILKAKEEARERLRREDEKRRVKEERERRKEAKVVSGRKGGLVRPEERQKSSSPSDSSPSSRSRSRTRSYSDSDSDSDSDKYSSSRSPPPRRRGARSSSRSISRSPPRRAAPRDRDTVQNLDDRARRDALSRRRSRSPADQRSSNAGMRAGHSSGQRRSRSPDSDRSRSPSPVRRRRRSSSTPPRR